MADINLTAAEVAQLILSIGNAAALSTKDKTSLVAAINETLATAEAGGSPKAEKVSYSGNIDGTTVANVKAALDALTAREQALVVRFTKQSSGTITADKTIAAILAAHSSGKPVTGIYANGDYQLLEAQGSVAYFASWTGVDTFMLKGAASAGVDSWTLERLDIKGTNVALKGNIDGEDFTTVAGAIAILNRRGADHVAYSGTIGETTVANVKAALDALAAREAVLIVNAQQSISNTITADKTYAEISAAGEGGKEVICVLTVAQIGSKAIFRLDHLGSKATFRQTYVSGNQTQTITLKVNSSDVWTMETEKETPAGIGAVPKSRTVNGKALSADITLASQDIGYSGSVGDAGSSPNTVSNVAEALVALTVGEPLNVTANFVDSGAASVAEWAVAGSGDYYNIGEGYYIIATTDTRYYVRVLGVTAMTQRVVQIWKYGRDYIDPTIEIWRCTAPGATPEMLLRYETYQGDLTIPNQRWDWQVPDYRSAKKGQVLMASGSDAKPGWGSLPMATASAAGGVKADAKTEDDTVPARIDVDGKLWVKGQSKSNWREGNPADDAYVVNRPGGYYTNPMAAETITWDGNATGLEKVVLADLGEAKLCAYLVQSNYGIERAALIGGTITMTAGTDETIITISDKGYGVNLSGNECWCDERKGIIRLDDFDNDYVYIIFELDTAGFPSRGVWFTGFEDNNGNMLMYTSKLQTVAVGDIVKIPGKFLDLPIPDVTAADNDKFLRVVNGTPTWVALTNVAEEGA